MNQKFERIARHLYQRKYRDAAGDWTTLYYARFVCRLKEKPRIIPLGSDESLAKDKLKKLEAKDVDRYDFDVDRQRVKAPERDGKASPFTFTEWSEKYPTFDDVKRKRSLPDELTMIRLHLKPFFGALLLTEIPRETLCRYTEHRSTETVIRGKTGHSKKTVHRGTISNELSLLGRMLRVAAREGYKVLVPSFEGLIVRTKRGGRALSDMEQANALEVFSPWMRWLAEFAVETCLSEGDLLRLTDDMVDWRRGVIVPEGGRKKTEVTQVSPLTQRARAILEEIKAEKKRGAIIPNVAGLVFTRPDGSPISKDMIHAQVEKAMRAGLKKFVFHNYRNTAMTQWRRKNVSVDAVMRAGGWSSTQMYRRYLDMNEDDVAAAFGIASDSQIATGIVTQDRALSRN